MAEIQHQRIKSIYGELSGLYKGALHDVPNNHFPWAIAEQVNGSIDELNQATGTDYSRFKLAHEPHMNNDYVTASFARTKMSAIVTRLEQEYGFNSSNNSANTPVVVTVQQNQMVNVNVIPIQQLISDINDDGLKIQLNDLRDAVETHKDPAKTRSILKTIMDKSWELFIKVLPYVLQHMGNNSV